MYLCMLSMAEMFRKFVVVPRLIIKLLSSEKNIFFSAKYFTLPRIRLYIFAYTYMRMYVCDCLYVFLK